MTSRSASLHLLAASLVLLAVGAGCFYYANPGHRSFPPDQPGSGAVTPAPNTLIPERVTELERRAEGARPELVFIGDSITQFWEREGAAVWAERYGDRALNLGCGWDQTQNVLWRIRQGHLDGLEPDAFVLLIGTNNTQYGEHGPREIAAGVEAIVRELRVRSPRSHVVLLAILPRGSGPDDPLRRNNQQANTLLRGLAGEDRVHFVDLGPRYVDGDGAIRPGLMRDGLHLTEEGYRVMADGLAPVLAEVRGSGS